MICWQKIDRLTAFKKKSSRQIVTTHTSHDCRDGWSNSETDLSNHMDSSISTLRSSWRWWTLPVWHISCHSFSSALTFHDFADDIFKAFQARSTSSRRVHLRTWNLPALLYFGAVFPCFRNTRSHFLQLDLLKSMSGRILFISHGNSMALCTTPRLPKWRALMTNWLNDASSLYHVEQHDWNT